jgi:hypothetical protein
VSNLTDIPGQALEFNSARILARKLHGQQYDVSTSDVRRVPLLRRVFMRDKFTTLGPVRSIPKTFFAGVALTPLPDQSLLPISKPSLDPSDVAAAVQPSDVGLAEGMVHIGVDKGDVQKSSPTEDDSKPCLRIRYETQTSPDSYDRHLQVLNFMLFLFH